MEGLINKLMEKKPMDLTFAEYRIALQLAKLSAEKVEEILKKAELLRQLPAEG